MTSVASSGPANVQLLTWAASTSTVASTVPSGAKHTTAPPPHSATHEPAVGVDRHAVGEARVSAGTAKAGRRSVTAPSEVTVSRSTRRVGVST